MLEIATSGPVARLTLARPEMRNALNAEVVQRLCAELDRIGSDRSVRVVVVSGQGSVFSAGADLRMMRELADADAARNQEDARAMGELFHRVCSLPKPVVARVNGPAIGGGVGLMAACDVVVAADTAFFQFSEVRLGIVPAVISPFCIRRLGPCAARRLFLTGERIDAREALRLGLVDQLSSLERLDDAVDAVTRRLRKAGPVAAGEAKRLVDTVSELPAADVLDYTADLIARLRATDEAREGMRAFLAKSRPGWADDPSEDD